LGSVEGSVGAGEAWCINMRRFSSLQSESDPQNQVVAMHSL
jgi:hypothetical protein